MKKALLIAPVHQVILDELAGMGYTCDVVKSITKEEALSVLGNYHGLITSNKLYVDKDLIDAGNQLLWIGRMGSGMEIIDVPYAREKGIVCVSSPEGNANAVAEQAIGMLLSLKHNIVKSHLELLQDHWDRDGNRGTEIIGNTIGIIGYGNNGALFAKKLVALGMQVIAYDPYVAEINDEGVTKAASLVDLYEQAQVISFHVPLTAETKLYFNAAFLENMKQPFILLNISRGGVVDLDVVLNGMNSGKILAAAIDVWPEEPITVTSAAHYESFRKLMRMTNFIGTTHIGGYSHEATYKMSYYVAEKLKKVFK